MVFVENIISKLKLDRFFSFKLILAIDLFLSFTASAVALMFVKTLLSSSEITIQFVATWLSLALVLSFIFFFAFKTYRTIIRHSTLREFAKICVASFLKVVLVGTIVILLPFGETYYSLIMALDLSLTIVLLLLVRVSMIVMYDILREKVRSSRKRMNVMVYGVSDKSVAVQRRLANSPHYNVCGFLNYGRMLKGQNIDGQEIFYFVKSDDLQHFKNRFFVDAIIFANEADLKAEESRLVEFCQANGLKVLVVPSIDEVVDGRIMKSAIREVKIEDLLGRDEIKISLKEIEENFKDKVWAKF